MQLPGLLYNAKVFANSTISKKVQSGKIPYDAFTLLPGYIFLPNSINGDPAHPLILYYMKEFPTCLVISNDLANHFQHFTKKCMKPKRMCL